MSDDWALRLPCRDENEPLNLLSIREVTKPIHDPIERRISSHVLETLWHDGCATFADALSLVDRSGPESRRRRLDQARTAVKLPSTRAVDDSRDLAAARRDDLPQPPAPVSDRGRDAEGRKWQSCPVDGCMTFPGDEFGRPVPHRARKWWCPEHRSLAAEGDLDDWSGGPQLRWGPGGGLERVLTPEEQRHYAEIDQRLKDEDEERRHQREAEAEVKKRAEEKYEADNPPDPYVSFPGLR